MSDELDQMMLRVEKVRVQEREVIKMSILGVLENKCEV